MHGDGDILPGAVAQSAIDALDPVRISPTFDLRIEQVVSCHRNAKGFRALGLKFERLARAIR